jgi:hypothetical protein
MTESEWLESSSPDKMLWHLRGPEPLCTPLITRRQLLLFTLACCRRVTQDLSDHRSIAAMDTFERWIEGQASDIDLNNAHAQATVAAEQAWANFRRDYPDYVPQALTQFPNDPWASAVGVTFVASLCRGHKAWMAALGSSRNIRRRAERAAGDQERRIQADLMRDIVGNPFRPITLGMNWLTPDVRCLAQAVYAEKTFQRMPELGAVLRASGCFSPQILGHCY